MLRELLDHIDLYLVARLSESALESWLLESLQAILDSGEPAAVEMANRLDVAFMQMGDGILTAEAFHGTVDAMARMARTILLEDTGERPDASYSSSAADTTFRVAMAVSRHQEDHLVSLRFA